MKLLNRRMYPLSVRLLLGIGVACLLIQSAHANLLFSEGFNYTAGSSLTNDDSWGGGTPVGTLQIAGGSLGYSGLPDVTGANNLAFAANGTTGTVTNHFSGGPTSGTLYYSFLIDCTTLPTAGNYYVSSIQTNATGMSGGGDPLSIYVGTVSTANTTAYKIGVRHQGYGSGAAYATNVVGGVLGTTLMPLAPSTTYLIVAKYTFGLGGYCSLFVNPDPSSGEPAVPNAGTGLGIDSGNALQIVGFKPQGATQGAYNFDDLRIGTTWADVVPEPSTFALVGLGMLGLALVRRMRG